MPKTTKKSPDLDRFSKNYLRQWNKRATVRSTEPYTIRESDTRSYTIPETMQPLANEPEVRALGKAAVRTLELQTFHNFLDDIARGEIDGVTAMCGRLANDEFSVSFPDSARQVALTVATDEAYHAFVAREYMKEIETVLGVEPVGVPPKSSAVDCALEWVETKAPDALKHDFWVITLCFAEHLITHELLDFKRDSEPGNAFHHVLSEHLTDEGRHQIFFEEVLRHFWKGLTEKRRKQIGKVLPDFLAAFHFGWFPGIVDWNKAALRGLGFKPKQAERIVKQCYARLYEESSKLKYDSPTVSHSESLMVRSELLAHAPTRKILVDAEWVRP